ncbi:MAG TPA: FimV/HubP family polar landmark protein [Rudaea sp.]|nr:FimV/HubP family polar landmark protein [Rudaea sp.]
MNGSSKLSLAVALALLGGNAFALGLGSIQLHSKLDQPLNADIPVLSATPAEVNVLKVGLASAEDFQRVGLSRARVGIPLEFSVSTDSSGQPVIKVTTKEIVREPFLDFLVEVNWPNGKVLREYTVLLDPPVMAPALRGSAATVSPAHEAAPAHPQHLDQAPHAKPKPIAATPPHPVAHAQTPPAKVQHAASPHAASGGQYGPVAQGETLSEIARATRPDESTNLNKVMLAMLKANPNAFFNDNINALKRGAILRIPSADEIEATGSALQAAAQVREQNQAWSASAPVSRPTLIATAGAPKQTSAAAKSTHSSTSAKSGNDAHLALVPPRAGKGSQTTADHPGAASGSANAATTAQLARTKEALASRDQEVGDLKSRVKELEDLHGKDQRLISLKQSELAQLQEKLKQLNAAIATKPVVAASSGHATPAAETAKPASATPTSTTATATTATPKLTEKDIWGDIGASEKTPPAKTAGTATPTTTVTPTPPAKSATDESPTTPVPGATTSPASTPATALTSASPPATTTAEQPAASTPPATTPKPTVHTAPVKSTPTTKPEPLTPVSVPWYQNSENLLMGGGIALIIIGLLALLRFMRKPKAPPVIADADDADADTFDAAHDGEEEHHLLDQLAQHPGDPQLSLELLSLYYAHNEVSKFEAAAEAMYAHIADPHQAEWQQVCAMGKEISPHNPLFDEHAEFSGFDHAAHDDFGHADVSHVAADHLDSGLHDSGDAHEDHLGSFDSAVKPDDDEGFDFDLTDHTATAPAPVELELPAPVHEEESPLPDHPVPPPPAMDSNATQTMAAPADDFFAGEDAIGTKLDLAKAYLDMGDPEGARSMLDEVMAEGNDAQKDEARKLLAEIH